MKKIIYFLVTGLVIFSSCERIAMHPDAGTSNIDIFNEYVKLVKEKFAMLEYKGVDIDHLHDSIGSTITDDLTEDELFAKLTIITEKLRDGHSDLTGDTTFYYDFFSGAPSAYDPDILYDNYIDVSDGIVKLEDDDGDIRVVYGNLNIDHEIGYMRIPAWEFELSFDEEEKIFKELSGYKALIIDVRDNTGGDPVLATGFASYFTDKEIFIGTERFKTGPLESDTAVSKQYLRPANSNYLLANKPVIVLTDIWCFSATTTFMYSLAPLVDVKFLGYKSGGGAGAVADGYLANGWVWSLSVSEFIDRNGAHWDEGHEPDIVQVLDPQNPDTDEVLERAYAELNR